MAFLNDEVGLERNGTKFSPAREPRIMDRFQEGGPERATTRSITGTPIGIEYHQDVDDARLELRWENLSEAEASILRLILNGWGPLTAKIEKGVATTYQVLIERGFLEPLIGHYPEGAPSSPAALRRWRATVSVLLLS